MSKWVLYDEFSKKYFKMLTGIGPAQTENVDEAWQFFSKEEALQSPAMRFSLTSFNPVEAPTKHQSKGDEL